MVEILQLVHKISSFPDVLYKRGYLKNFSKFTDDYKKQSSGYVLSKDVPKYFAKFKIKLQAGNLKLSEAGTGDILQKKVFLKKGTGVSEPAVHRFSANKVFLNNSQNSQVKTCFGVSF